MTTTDKLLAERDELYAPLRDAMTEGRTADLSRLVARLNEINELLADRGAIPMMTL